MKVKSESEVAQLCPSLRDPVDCSLPGSSIHGIFQARVLEWVAVDLAKNLGWRTGWLVVVKIEVFWLSGVNSSYPTTMGIFKSGLLPLFVKTF